MTSRSLLIVLAIGLTPAALRAQGSQFGVRGLGIPVRPLSTRALGTGGGIGLFDPESSENPAAVAGLPTFTAGFNAMNSFRSSNNPFGSSSGRDSRFPQILAQGPIGGTRLSASLSVSGYTDRSFALGTRDSVNLKGTNYGVFDTLSSRGGLTDFRLAGGWQLSPTFALGLGLHAITGTNRVQNRRTFADSTFVPAVEQADLSYLGLGVSVGFTWRVVPRLTLAGMYRNDGHLRVERDSTPIGNTDLPQTAAVGIRFQPSARLALAGSYSTKNWSTADADLKRQGGIGAFNAYEVAGGLELLHDQKNPGRRPWRFGAHYSTLPFPVQPGRQPHEFGVALGTGLRIPSGRASFDFALEQVWRSDGADFREHATVFTVGLSIKP